MRHGLRAKTHGVAKYTCPMSEHICAYGRMTWLHKRVQPGSGWFREARGKSEFDEETNMGKGVSAWMQWKERFDKVEEEEYVKETFDLTLLRRVTLCIRRV